MRKFIVAIVFVFSAMSCLPAGCPTQSIEPFAKSLAEAYAANKLQTLDEKYPHVEEFRVIIEHSIGGDSEPELVFKSVKSFTGLAKYLKRRRRSGSPFAASKPLKKCANGLCLFDFSGGIGHNTLYLHEIRYWEESPCHEILYLWFLDGD